MAVLLLGPLHKGKGNSEKRKGFELQFRAFRTKPKCTVLTAWRARPRLQRRRKRRLIDKGKESITKEEEKNKSFSPHKGKIAVRRDPHIPLRDKKPKTPPPPALLLFAAAAGEEGSKKHQSSPSPLQEGPRRPFAPIYLRRNSFGPRTAGVGLHTTCFANI